RLGDADAGARQHERADDHDRRAGGRPDHRPHGRPRAGRRRLMARTSAGVLLWRRGPDGVEVLIGHMGGPFWAKKDAGGWSIPKGEYGEGEEAFAVALREFEEELGSPCPADDFTPLGEVKASGKTLTVWAAEGDLDATACVSNTFEIEWPPRS